MNLKLHITNKRVTPNVGVSIFHAGKNDYRVVIDGVGEYYRTTQLGLACAKASHVAGMDQDNTNWVCAAIQSNNADAHLTV